ncbi:MAG TPA: hypothetical protein VIH76_04870 [Candidatus Acidoferrales bacterium]
MAQPVFDRRLYDLKFAELCHELRQKTSAATRRVPFEQRKLGQGEGAGFYEKLVDAHLEILGEHLEGVDRICREVWRKQGGIETPDFVRAVVRNRVFATIAARCSAIRGEIELTAERKRFKGLTPILHHLAQERAHLENRWANRYDIEARELGYANASAFELRSTTIGSVREPENRRRVFIEDAGPLSFPRPEGADSYSKFRTKTLQKRLAEIDGRLLYLNQQFPEWRVWGGYGPGNTPPPYYDEILHLEEERERLILALSKRVKLETKPALHNARRAAYERGKKTEGEHQESERFTHSPDYRSVSLRGKTYGLTTRQAQMIQILHEQHEQGNPDVGKDFVLEQLGTRNSRWQDTFKSNRQAREALITTGSKRGTLRLNI